MKTTPWSPEEVSRALEMRRNGTTLKKVGAALGRSAKAVKTKLLRHEMPPDLLIKQRRAERGRYKTSAKMAGVEFEAHRARAPEKLIAERNRRSAIEPRDLTAAFCGDPLPGYSALDRRA